MSNATRWPRYHLSLQPVSATRREMHWLRICPLSD